jgi:hypothetical protein
MNFSLIHGADIEILSAKITNLYQKLRFINEQKKVANEKPYQFTVVFTSCINT